MCVNAFNACMCVNLYMHIYVISEANIYAYRDRADVKYVL